jgi:hypothetical protein
MSRRVRFKPVRRASLVSLISHRGGDISVIERPVDERLSVYTVKLTAAERAVV